MIESVIVVLGLALVAYGAFLVHPSLCWIVLGVGCLAVGLGMDRGRGAKRR